MGSILTKKCEGCNKKHGSNKRCTSHSVKDAKILEEYDRIMLNKHYFIRSMVLDSGGTLSSHYNEVLNYVPYWVDNNDVKFWNSEIIRSLPYSIDFLNINYLMDRLSNITNNLTNRNISHADISRKDSPKIYHHSHISTTLAIFGILLKNGNIIDQNDIFKDTLKGILLQFIASQPLIRSFRNAYRLIYKDDMSYLIEIDILERLKISQ
jgi:hypothetical protein